MRWVVAVVLVSTCGPSLGDEVEITHIRKELDAAVETYLNEIEEIADEVEERIDRLIQNATKGGDLDSVQQLRREKDLFLKDGTLPKETHHHVSRTRLAQGVRKAVARLSDVYTEAVESLTKANRIQDAQRIQNEFEEVKKTFAFKNAVSVPDTIASARKKRTPKANLPETVVNSIGVRLRLIPPGTFTMGEGETAHQVTLTQPFYLGVTEVTNAQWKSVMGFVTSQCKDEELPVESLSWEEAVKFCEVISSLPAEKRAGRVYRLPTEAEWEFACRAGSTTAYSFGDDVSLIGDFAWFKDNAGDQTHPVSQKRPNAWGLYDIHGNVLEWCSDWSGDYPRGSVTDPHGAASGSYRVYRGGSWYRSARDCRSSLRRKCPPSRRYADLGFRLALSPSGVKTLKAGQ